MTATTCAPKKKKRREPDHTPEQIEATCQKIQAGWSDKQHAARRVDHATIVHTPVYATCDLWDVAAEADSDYMETYREQDYTPKTLCSL